MMRNKKGFVIQGVAAGFFGFMALAIVANLSLPQLKDPHRKKKAVELCYCMERGMSEGVCKAKLNIDVEQNEDLDFCNVKVDNMSKKEVCEYIADNVLPDKVDKNHGYINI